MRKIFFSKRVLLPAAVALTLLASGCGTDEPNPNPEPPDTDKPGANDTNEPDNPEAPDEPEEPDTPEESKHYTPEESEFYGRWRVCWEKIEWYRCFNNKWSFTESDIYDGPTSWHSWYGWPYYLGILKDAYGYLCTIHETSAFADIDNLISLIEQKGSKNYYDEVLVKDGVLSGNGVSHAEWHPNASKNMDMMIFMTAKGTVWERWKITEFDGESFIASPAHYDFPKAEDGSNYAFTTYKFVRYIPQD